MCQLPCSVSQLWHPPTHSCHFGDCTVCCSCSKECVGGHVILRTCLADQRTSDVTSFVGRPGSVVCMHVLGACHPSPCDVSAGPSNSSRASCGQTCGAPRRDCRHTSNVPYDAGGPIVDSVLEASIIQKLPSPLQPIEANGKKVPLGQRKLTCDDECAKMEKKKVLSDAFGAEAGLMRSSCAPNVERKRDAGGLIAAGGSFRKCSWLEPKDSLLCMLHPSLKLRTYTYSAKRLYCQ
ncbi:hypothetical protein HAX54_024330 [Datura stramonium]|uniref:Uncharacterized protein n=1 Tax=Datura stramonium TaxID=4076 RepID=A0ABS8S696_DATST|nr:hypothetical protein [Datura stramonium]